VITNDVSDYYR